MAKENKCPYELDLTNEEETAMRDLCESLRRTVNACGTHSRKSAIIHRAIGKLFSKVHAQHDILHLKDAELNQAETIVAGMTGISTSNREHDGGGLN